VMLTHAQRLAAERLERVRASLLDESSARVRSLEVIGARLAHELKNPLTALKGLLPLVARDPADERARARFDVMAEEVAHMETILGGYLSFSRPLEDLEPRPLDLHGLVDEVLAVLEGRATGAGVSLCRRGEEVALRADARRLRDALLNLVSNAIEASSRGGSVEVALSRTDEGAVIAIRDAGRGMSPAVQARVGTPYFTTRDGGTGLGIVLARAIIVQHGGALAYESRPGSGTVATIRMPYAPPTAQPKEPR
jgi:signal transduction histidine kinase